MGDWFQYEKQFSQVKSKNDSDDTLKKQKDDSDLIIEENTIYEVDRECYERLKRQRKRKAQEKKNV